MFLLVVRSDHVVGDQSSLECPLLQGRMHAPPVCLMNLQRWPERHDLVMSAIRDSTVNSSLNRGYWRHTMWHFGIKSSFILCSSKHWAAGMIMAGVTDHLFRACVSSAHDSAWHMAGTQLILRERINESHNKWENRRIREYKSFTQGHIDSKRQNQEPVFLKLKFCLSHSLLCSGYHQDFFAS